MPNSVSDKLRVFVDQALSSTRGNEDRPVKLLREVLGTANDLVGRPFCTEEELARRRAWRASARPAPVAAAVPVKAAPAQPAPVAAPVMVYFDGKDHRSLAKVEELLKARGIPYKLLDVTDDESTRSWASTTAKAHEFPLVFIAGESIGGLDELTQADVTGELKRRVF